MTCVNKIYLLCYFENNIQIYLVDYTNVFGSLFKPRKMIYFSFFCLSKFAYIFADRKKNTVVPSFPRS